MKARDVMTRTVVTVPPDMSVQEVARILLERRISAVPVLDREGNVVGIVSEGDLVRQAGSETERSDSWWLRWIALPDEYVAGYVQPGGRLAGDVMTRTVHSVDEETSVREIAELLERKRIKRVPVLRAGRLVGIVSRANLLHSLATLESAEFPSAPSADRPSADRPSADTKRSAKADLTVREAIMTAVGQEHRNDIFINVIVSNGTIHLWGLVDSEADRQAVRHAAERAGGGRAIDDHLGITPPYVRSMMWT